MYLGFFSSHSVVSPALTCAELTEAPLGMGRAAEEEGASRERAEGGPSQCVCVCVLAGRRSSYICVLHG